MVRVAGETVRSEDALPVHRAEDVDRRVPPGDRLDEDRVEVSTELGDEQLHDSVHRVERDAAAEGAERVPVEAVRATAEERHAGDEEAEVEHELEHALRPLREGLLGVQVEEPGEVQKQERDEERECDGRGARQPRISAFRAIPDDDDEEPCGEDVGEREVRGELPLDLRERDEQDRREEEHVDRGLDQDALARGNLGGARAGRA